MAALDFGVTREASSGGPVQTREVQSSSSTGIVAGLFGIVFGLLGIFSIGLVFVPLAALCSVFGLIRAITAGGVSGIGTSAIGGFLTVAGAIVSPSVWALVGGVFAVNAFGGGTPKVAQQPTRATGVASVSSLTLESPRSPKPPIIQAVGSRSAFAEQPGTDVKPADRPLYSSNDVQARVASRRSAPPSEFVGSTNRSASNAALTAPAAQPAVGPKSDIRGFRPGMPSELVLAKVRAAGLGCRDENAVGYRRCKNQLQSDQVQYEEFEFYSAANALYAVKLTFHSGNDFRSLVGVITNQFAVDPSEIGSLDRAEWRLRDGSVLQFRKSGYVAVLTLGNPQIEAGLRSIQSDARRQINATPRF